MTLLLVLLVLIAVTTTLVREVRNDGYGRRPAPRSHWSDLPVPWDRRLC